MNTKYINKLYIFTQFFDNTEILLNVFKYLIEPSILIINHYYTKDGELKIIINKEFTHNQIEYNIMYINALMEEKYKNYKFDSFTIFLEILDKINEINLTWRNTGQTLKFDENYIRNNWVNTMIYSLNPDSYPDYKKNILILYN